MEFVVNCPPSYLAQAGQSCGCSKAAANQRESLIANILNSGGSAFTKDQLSKLDITTLEGIANIAGSPAQVVANFAHYGAAPGNVRGQMVSNKESGIPDADWNYQGGIVAAQSVSRQQPRGVVVANESGIPEADWLSAAKPNQPSVGETGIPDVSWE